MPLGHNAAVTAPERWPRFIEDATIVEDPAVRRSWRRDRRPFYVAVVLLPVSGPLQQRRHQVLDGLSPWCRPSAPGQPHVTLAALGTDPALARRVGRALGGRCDVVVGGADSFSAAAFLGAAGEDLVAARESVLATAAEVGAPPRWVPHVTVGTYRCSVARGALAARLAPWRNLPPLLLTGSAGLMIVDRSGRHGGLLPVPAEPIRPPACKPAPIAPH